MTVTGCQLRGTK